jgi:hypothetical protein
MVNSFLNSVSQVGVVTSTVGLAVLAQMPDPVETGKALGGFTTAEVLGVVAVLSIVAMVMLYRDSRKDNAKLQKIIEENTAASQRNADTISQNVGILVEVKDAIIKCKGNGDE